jgi:two-component system response regulator YesN
MKNKGKEKIKAECIKEYVKENAYSPSISNEKVAQHFHISYAQLCKIFKKYFNNTILNYINECRLEMACEYIKNTDINIQDIATKVGYLNTVSFNRMFKKTMRCSPLEYREKSRDILKGEEKIE